MGYVRSNPIPPSPVTHDRLKLARIHACVSHLNPLSILFKDTIRFGKRRVEVARKRVEFIERTFFIGEKRSHFKRLIEESIQYWEYAPCSSGEMISTKHSPHDVMGMDMAGSVGTSYIPPYLEQAKSHLKAYKEIWKLYEAAPNIYQKQKQQEQALKDHLKSKLKDEIDAKRITVTASDIKNMLDITYQYILGNMNREPEKRGSFKAEVVGDVILVGGIDMNRATDIQNATALTNILNHLLKGKKAEVKARAFLKICKETQQNTEQFKRLLRIEVIEKVRLSNYTVMKGQCSECDNFGNVLKVLQ